MRLIGKNEVEIELKNSTGPQGPRGKTGAAGAKGDTGKSGVTFKLSGTKLYITTG